MKRKWVYGHLRLFEDESARLEMRRTNFDQEARRMEKGRGDSVFEDVHIWTILTA